MDNKNAKELIDKYLDGKCNPEETAIIETWYNDISRQENVSFIPDYKTRQREIRNLLPVSKKINRKLLLWPGIAAAAVLAILIVGYNFYNAKKDLNQADIVSDIKAGGNKAFLILNDGKKIVLSDVREGNLIQKAGLTIRKTRDGQLVYTVSDNTSAAAGFNVIQTPAGGQYQVVLPDGTKVWLNAASSLRYPVIFNDKDRKVELTGEGYFEVAPDKLKPFKVKTNKQEVIVLGTHFNINAYSDEEAVKTTLLEGSVKIRPYQSSIAQILLKPGQQAILAGSLTNVIPADSESALAWKNGDFIFKGEDFKSTMRKIARWYDVEIVYETPVANDLIPGGWISRSKNISAVLDIIESTGMVHFKVEGRRVTVTK